MTDITQRSHGQARRPEQRSPLAIMTSRQTRMLRTAMGEAIAAALEDPEVVEILLNPDGTLWFDRLDTGRRRSGICLSREDGDRIIRLVAAHLRLEELATMRGLSKSSVVAAALASFLSPDGADQREAVIARRLDRLTRQFDLLERDQTILIEAVALFIRHYLTVSTPVPVAHQEAVRAQGRARFEQFVEQLGRHLHRGQSLARRLTEELGADGREYAKATEEAVHAIGEGGS